MFGQLHMYFLGSNRRTRHERGRAFSPATGRSKRRVSQLAALRVGCQGWRGRAIAAMVTLRGWG